MTQRERTMAIILLVGIFAAVGGFVGYQFILSPLQGQRRMIANLQDDIDQREKRVDEIGHDYLNRYQPLRKLSLPADVDLARREYEMQLSGLLRRSDFQPSAIQITPRPPESKNAPVLVGKKTAYTRLDFVVQVKGELGNLVDFMDHFYRQPLLHQVRSLTITRPTRTAADRGRATNDLDIHMMIEALVLEDAENRQTLVPVPDPLTLMVGQAGAYRLGSLAVETGKGSPYDMPRGRLMKPEDQPGRLAIPTREYASIAGKNIFFGPPPAPIVETEPEAPAEDLSPFIRLTSLSESDGYRRAHVFDLARKEDHQIEQRPDGTLSVDVYFYVHKSETKQDVKKRHIRDREVARDLEFGDKESGNYVRLKIVAMTDTALIVQEPAADGKEKKALAAAPVIAGGVAALVSPGKMYKWQIGKALSEKVPLKPAELRRELSGTQASPRPSRGL